MFARNTFAPGLIAALLTCLLLEPTSAASSVRGETLVPAGSFRPHAQVARPLQVAQLPSANPASIRAPGKRIALVVGISNYRHVGRLQNTLNDARKMAAAFVRMGFDVEAIEDADRATLEGAVRRYGNRSTGADVSVFYYAGHAVEALQRNWMLPASVDVNKERDLRFEAIDLNAVLEQTDGAARVSITFLDACRDNPLANIIAAGSRSSPKGLARVEMTAGGALIAFSTAPGQTAQDGDAASGNSPFTTALLKHIETPGLEIKSMLAKVTRDVVDATKGKQRPWQNSSLEGDFYFLPPANSAVAPQPHRPVDAELVFWDTIKTSRDPADFKAYLKQFPNGVFAGLAQNRLAMLQQPSVANVSAAAPPRDTVPATIRPPGDQVSSSVSSLASRLVELSVSPLEANARGRDYVADKSHKAMAIAPDSHFTWRSTNHRSEEAAIAATLEGCQLRYNTPCVLVARNGSVVPSTSEPTTPRDMPRVKYAGRFEPDQIPVAWSFPGQVNQPPILSYAKRREPRAIAFHPWGRVFVSTEAGDQFEAEQQALAQCNEDPFRKGADGPCFLYAVGDQVILPQRLTKPRLRPKTISEAFAYLGVPRYSYNYGQDKAHKAIAVAPESGQTFRWSSQASAAIAEQYALEGCQLSYRTRCFLLASNDALSATFVGAFDRRDMPRVNYRGLYSPENVPLFSSLNPTLRSYATTAEPKALVIRGSGARIRMGTGASTHEAQLNALKACNDDLDPLPCFVYAINNDVVLTQRLTEPLR